MTVEVLKRVNADGKKVVHAGYVLFPSLGWLAESPNGRTMWVSASAIYKRCLSDSILRR